jgi:adenine deaminase
MKLSNLCNLTSLTSLTSLQKRIDSAQGRVPCDLILKSATYLDVFSCEWLSGDLAITDGVIVGVNSGLYGRRTENLSGEWVVPGFIDAHVHVESSMMTPRYFQESVLSRGTTSALCDPHELANVMGTDGIQYFLNASESLSMDLWVMLSSCVPSTTMETNGAGEITADQLLKFISHPRVKGLAEVMNVPGVLNGDRELLSKIQHFENLPKDGHCPLVRGNELSAYASTGISTCHESSELEEAREKLSKGIAVWMREGSVAKDLKTLSPLLTLATSTSVGFCTDDRNPWDISREGHLDYLIRSGIQHGIIPEVAYRSASWTVARHYRLDQGPNRVGAIAPGYQADLVILEDLLTCAVKKVLKKGKFSSEIKLPRALELQSENTIRAQVPEVLDLEGPQGWVHVIGVVEGKIITEHRLRDSSSPGVAKLSVLERYGKGSKPANAYVEGFGIHFKGAIASSVGHDSHNLIVVGDNTSDMRVALAAVIEMGGGFCLVQEGSVRASLSLNLGGLMCDQSAETVKDALSQLKNESKKMGCVLSEPFLQLAFLSLPVIPALKLTDQGLVDVNRFQIIDVRAS